MKTRNWLMIRPDAGTASRTAAMDGTLADSVHRLMAVTGLAMVLIGLGATTSFAQTRAQAPNHFAETVPSFDIRSICRHANDPTVETTSGCTSDEKDAHDWLGKNWTKYPARQRADCVASMTELPSYVELQTCLQIDHELENEKAEQASGKSASPSVDVPMGSSDPVPLGSSDYVPPPVPSDPSPATTQPAVQPYNPPPITTFSDRVNSAIQSYPLQRGLGNNPTNEQEYIRQKSN